MKILLAGYGKFPGMEDNHSSRIVRDVVTREEFLSEVIRTLEIPNVFRECPVVLSQAISDSDPDMVILVGVKFSASSIHLEKVALNVLNSIIPDCADEKASHLTIIEGEREAYFSAIPLQPLLEKLEQASIASKISYYADTYICNQAYYIACSMMTKRRGRPVALLVHIPRLPEQVTLTQKGSTLAYDISLKAITIILKTILSQQ